MAKVFDVTNVKVSVAPGMYPVGRASGMRELSIEAALRWAFGSECARIDFDEETDPDSFVGSGSSDSVWKLMQRGRIGCRVDGGGFSPPSDDAQMIVSQVAALDVGCGGRKMAIQIAQLSRVGMRPDWMPGARPRCVAEDWRGNRHGGGAAMADAKDLGAQGWPSMERRNRKGVVVRDPVRYCPVIYTPTARTIAAARRNYLQWWGALLEVGSYLRLTGVLGGIKITSAMPPMHPWREESS
ncbi:hypothetical protein [uncultured Thioclava sp.]|uniref:hypothetical protein n=1 Tax=uncultured Thioclava sp. TaxID=473858 RepID=UPI0025F74C23|nr:hypothetical protein [uncultured Thioclava sp.]